MRPLQPADLPHVRDAAVTPFRTGERVGYVFREVACLQFGKLALFFTYEAGDADAYQRQKRGDNPTVTPERGLCVQA
jgi:hypothetical protein